MIALWIALACAVLILLVLFICFYLAFYVPRRNDKSVETFAMPGSEIYARYHDIMSAWRKETAALPHEDIEITSYDGLTLHGKLYEFEKNAPIELMLHGYRGSAERDLCGGVQRCFSMGRSALLVDMRTSGQSDGHVISFGIKERHDCLSWATYLYKRFGNSRKVMLTGISMGAATVLMTSAMTLPDNVVGVLADCGYTDAKEIIYNTIRQLKLPPKPLYPFVRLAGRLLGGFDVEETSPIEAVKHATVPIIFIHGEDDTMVPCDMSRRNFEACTAEKRLLTVKGAGHGLSYIVEPQAYLDALREFSVVCGMPVINTTNGENA